MIKNTYKDVYIVTLKGEFTNLTHQSVFRGVLEYSCMCEKVA